MISIIVPVYNVEKWLDCCIESIVNQTYKDIEIILVDDGSTDNSGRMCDDWAKRDSRIKVLHIENGGVSRARNIGISNATGDWIMFLDADDWLEGDACERLLNVAIQNNAEIVSGSFIWEYEDRTEKCWFEIDEGEICKLDTKELELDLLYTEDRVRLKSGAYLHAPWGRIIKASLIKDSGLEYVVGIRTGEDMVFNLALFRKTTEHYLANISVVHYRKVEGSALNSKKKDYFSDTEKMYYALKDYLYSQTDLNVEEFCERLKALIMGWCINFNCKNVVHICNYNLLKMTAFLRERLGKECFRVAFDENTANRFGLKGHITSFMIKTIIKEQYVLLALTLILVDLWRKIRGDASDKGKF